MCQLRSGASFTTPGASGVISKVNSHEVCQLLTTISHKMAPRKGQSGAGITPRRALCGEHPPLLHYPDRNFGHFARRDLHVCMKTVFSQSLSIIWSATHPLCHSNALHGGGYGARTTNIQRTRHIQDIQRQIPALACE